MCLLLCTAVSCVQSGKVILQNKGESGYTVECSIQGETTKLNPISLSGSTVTSKAVGFNEAFVNIEIYAFDEEGKKGNKLATITQKTCMGGRTPTLELSSIIDKKSLAETAKKYFDLKIETLPSE